MSHGFGQAGREQAAQQVGQLLFGRCSDIAQNTGVQLLGVQAGLQVDGQGHILRRKLGHVGRCAQHQRAAHAKVGKEHFAKLRVEFLFAAIQGELHVFEGQALQILHPSCVAGEPHQRGQSWEYVVAVAFQPLPAVAGGAGGLVALTAGADDDRVRAQLLAVFQRDAGDDGFLRIHASDAGVEAHVHIQLTQRTLKGAGHIAGLLALGEYAVAALHHHGAAVVLQPLHQRGGRQGVERAVEEAGILDHAFHKRIRLAGVGGVAASLAGDVDLFAQLFVALKQSDMRACFCGSHGSHETGSAAADNDYFFHDSFLSI